MKHFGQLLDHQLSQCLFSRREIAKAVGLTTSHLWNIIHKKSIDAELMEKLCKATGLDICEVFEEPRQTTTNIQSGNSAHSEVGDAVVSIVSSDAHEEVVRSFNRLLREKDARITDLQRTIDDLRKMIGFMQSKSGSCAGTNTEQTE